MRTKIRKLSELSDILVEKDSSDSRCFDFLVLFYQVFDVERVQHNK